MIVDGIRDGKPGRLGQARIQLLHPRVQPSDDSLQLSKFFHQLGGEIGLGQARGLVNDSRPDGDAVLLELLAEPTAQSLYALRLVVITSEILLKCHMLQRIQTFEQ